MSLNERQQEAVDHDDGPLLVLAGAGSGKTRVLVHRIARLIEQGRARPHEILAVTFTNKAARELVDRCTARVGAAATEVWAGTFHGIGARLMRRHAAELGYPAEFSIFDADDQMRLIKQLLEDAGIDPTVVPPEAVRAFIERHKNEARLPADVSAATDDVFGSRALDLYAAYQKRLRALGGVDFGDLILGVIVLLRSRPELLERYRQRFRHVLVDEYQDTNHAQYLMVSMLAEGHRNICVVGDDDQSIYAWRGANVRNILEFERDFSGAHVVRLDQNYRSTRNIIEAAHAVISNNCERMDKRMWTDSGDGRPITVYTAADERDEARYVVEQLIDLGETRSDA
ncbi:MAG: UvrD-helicase domain-containing protein, partial [Candidatus Binatia bacterium]